MQKLCVFLGSNFGNEEAYSVTTRALGEAIAARGITLVYGGSSVGLMGLLADTVLHAGGHVIGVIPRPLIDKELAHAGLSQLIRVESMHERKARMAQLADGFMALPGGLGTFEEFFEVLTWTQLGFHFKPCAVLNVAGYYDGLLSLVQSACDKGFVKPEHRDMVLHAEEPAELLDAMQHYTPSHSEKWVRRAEQL